MQVESLGQKDPAGGGNDNALHILAWEIPQTEGPDRLQSVGSQRVEHDLATEQKQCDLTCDKNDILIKSSQSDPHLYLWNGNSMHQLIGQTYPN